MDTKQLISVLIESIQICNIFFTVGIFFTVNVKITAYHNFKQKNRLTDF